MPFFYSISLKNKSLYFCKLLQDIKNTIKQSAVYGLSRISSKLVGFILLPLYSLHFSLSEYGVIGRLETLWQILWAILLFGLESGIVRWYTLIEDEDKKKKFLFSLTIFLVLFNFFGLIILYFSSGLLSSLIFESNQYSKLVFYTAIIATLEALVFVQFLLLRIKEKAFSYSILAIFITLINFGFQVYYLQYTSVKLEGIFLSKIFSPAIGVIILAPFFVKNLKIGIDKENLKELLKYSFPMMLASVSVTFLNQFDRYMLGYLANDDLVGTYVLGNNISGLITFLIISPFSLAFTVISWKKLQDENAKRFYTKTITYFYFIILMCVIFVSLFTPNFIKIFTLNTKYWTAKEIVPWISLAIPFYGIHHIATFSFYVTKKTHYVLWCYLLAFMLKVILNIILIPIFNIYGAAISNYTSFLALNLFLYLLSRHQYFIPYEWNKIILMSVIGILILIPFFYFKFETLAIQVVLKLLAIVLFPLLLYPFKFYENIEVIYIKGFFKKYLLRKN
jgi:O-antigen/teichoic acid export membrane protein